MTATLERPAAAIGDDQPSGIPGAGPIPPVVAGIDLSLTSTGVAVIHSAERVLTHTVTSAAPKIETLSTRFERMESISHRILELVETADVVGIESPAYAAAAHSGKLHDRSGLWWHVVSALLTAGKQVIEIAPASRCMYATGKGNAGKDVVLACTIKAYRQIDVQGNDQADAVIIAAMVSRLLGRPIEPGTLAEAKLRALAKVALTD